jgi:molecular chaperone GrpE
VSNKKKSAQNKVDAAGQADQPETQNEQQPEEAPAAASGAVEEISLTPEEAARIITEKEECYDRLLRTQADFDNYRKRVQKEQANLIRYGAENALREILPAVDNLERAVDAARKQGELDSHLEGLELILAQMREVLGRLGVKPVETVGTLFDPNKHDALIRIHAPDVPEGVVVDEIRKGYYLYDKVLRPAQVTVGTHEQVGDS